jgi:beta-alanine--pyruvate transaminase
MSAVAVKDEIYDKIVNEAPAGIEFFHGYTWSANPIACAAALATLKVYADEDLFARGKTLSVGFMERLASLAKFPVVTGIRGFGMLGAIDLATGDAPGARGFAALQALYANGVVIRVTLDTIILAPPFVMTEDQMDELFDKLSTALGAM